nr:MAG: hypothetical protein [Microvirus sp.]
MNKEKVIFELCQMRDDAFELMMSANQMLAEVTGVDTDLVWAEFISVVQADQRRLAMLKAEN